MFCKREKVNVLITTILFVTSYVDRSFFFGTLIMRNTKCVVECDMMPASSKSFNTAFSQTLHLKDNMYGFWSKGFTLTVSVSVTYLTITQNTSAYTNN